jgi:hypothetical protein
VGRLPADQAAALIASKLADGRLPSTTADTILRGLGTGHPCTACGRQITTSEIETECIFRDGQSIRMHMECFEAWDRARRR